ncbi:MAG: class I SAM-dependent methyltransferase [Acidobacteriota bacterium]
MKRYDRAYFDKWYRGRDPITTAAELRRKVALAVAEAEYFLRRPLRSVLDIACGEGAWFPHLKALRPRASYRGIDPSPYTVKTFGKKRHIEQGTFRDVARIDRTFDLVVCADALHYIGDDEILGGLPDIVRVAGGIVFLEVLTREDEIVGDLEGFIRRPAKWYRARFDAAGLTQVGPYTWLSPRLREDAAELET